MGSTGTQYITTGTNIAGTATRVPKASVERQLEAARRTYQSMLDTNVNPNMRSFGPNDFRSQEEEIERLEKLLKG